MNSKERNEQKRIKLEDKCRDFNWVKEQFEANKLYISGSKPTKGAFDKFRLAVKTTNEVYENFWDLEINVTELPAGGSVEGFRYDVRGIVVRFPEIIIKNSRNRQHTIHELYVMVQFYVDGTSLRISGLAGGRMKQSYAEYTSNYAHSHLPGGINPNDGERSGNAPYWRSFCRGSGHINDFIAEINSGGLTMEKFTPFLVQILGLVSWESLEGGPHRRIANISIIGNSGRRSNPSNAESEWHLNNIMSHYRSSNITPPIDFAWESNGYTITDNEKFDKFISESIEIPDNQKHRIICMQDNQGNYYKWGSIPEFNAPRTPSRNTYIFQGQELTYEIEPAPSVGAEDQINYFIHPNIKRDIKARLEYDINIKKIRESTINRYSDKIEDATKSPRPDKVAV